MDPMQRFGARCRAVRIQHGWRQADVGKRAGVDRSTISRIELGRLDRVSFGTILGVARALDIQVQLIARWRGGDLDRLVNKGHSELHESVARMFASDLPDWILAPEVTYSIFGERGVIDILAWHPGLRALIVIELKTDIVDVNDLVGSMDRRRRLASEIAADRGWEPLTVSCWVIVAGAGRIVHDLRLIGPCCGTRSPWTVGRCAHGCESPTERSRHCRCGRLQRVPAGSRHAIESGLLVAPRTMNDAHWVRAKVDLHAEPNPRRA